MGSVRHRRGTIRAAIRMASRCALAVTLVGAMTLSVAVPADAATVNGPRPAAAPLRADKPAPTPPPNPSDDDINSSLQQANTAAAQVGTLSGRMTATESKINHLSDTMEAKAELANKASVDLGIAQDDAATADKAATAAATVAGSADSAVTDAQQKAADFAAASFRNGSRLGSMTALLGADSPTDLLQRDAVLEQISASQLDVIGQLESARNDRANKDAAARAALQQAQAAQKAAQQAAVVAQQAQQTAAKALESGQQQLQGLQTQLAAEQKAYSDALNNTASLKSERDAYNQWLAEKKAEEARERAIAEQRHQEALAEAARQATAAKAAAVAKAEAQAQAQAAAQATAEAAAQAKAEAAAKAKQVADALAAAKAQKASDEAAAVAKKQQHDAAVQAEAAAKAAAAAKATDTARANAAAVAKAQQAAATSLATERERDAANKKAADVQKAADEQAALADKQQKAAATLQARATDLDRIANARKAKQLADKLKLIRGHGTGGGVYFQNCDAARAAGFGPIRKGDPGYRAALDPNNNGVACDGGLGTSDGGTSSGGGSPSAGSLGNSGGGTTSGGGTPAAAGNTSVPNDGSKGAIVVNAALRYLGTPYSWGGGDGSGPTLGISSGCTSYCQQFQPWNTVGFDCSGLTEYAWAQAGVSLPHYSAYQYFSGQHISRDQLQPGDLVFFATDTSDPNTIHHVAIYMGPNQLIEAEESGTFVHIRNWRDDSYIGATRPGT